MANITTNLGPVSAYLDAVAHGYKGTREEFGEYLAHVGDNAAAAAESARQAAASGSSAESSATAADASATAAAESATAADESATDAGNAQTAAEEAKIAAQTAQSGAEAAQGAAEDAQEAAEDAQAAAEAVLASIPEDYTALTEEVDGLKSATNYVEAEILNDAIPYGLHETVTNAGFTVTANGNVITLSGRSSATAGQWGTKILISDHLQTWNAADDPATAQTNTIPTIKDHIYRASLQIISGTIDPGTGSGGMRLYVKGTTDTRVEIPYSVTSGDVTIVGDGNPVRLVLVMQRLLTATNLVLRITMRDITLDQIKAEIDEQSADKTVSIITDFTSNKLWSVVDGVVTLGDTEYSYSASAPISVTPGDRLIIRIYGGASANQNPVYFAKSDYTHLLTYTGTRSAWNTFDVYVPADAAYLLLNTTTHAYGRKASVNKVIGIRQKTSFEGCKMSLLGDSLSAIAAYCDHYYYPSEDSDVYSGEQMWWKIVCDQMGMTPLVVGAWSGSCVTSGLRAESVVPASDASRCEALGDGTNNPDVVLLAIGANDYSYMSDNSQFGTWDGTTALGSAADLSDYDTTTFKTAYATMIARVQKAYPNAFVVAITPWFLQRYTTNTGANYLNAIGKDISAYSDAVRDVCKIMHVPCIDGTNIGFNRRNYYPTYSRDSATQATHPTAAGQAQIAKAIIAQLNGIHRLGS